MHSRFTDRSKLIEFLVTCLSHITLYLKIQISTLYTEDIKCHLMRLIKNYSFMEKLFLFLKFGHSIRNICFCLN